MAEWNKKGKGNKRRETKVASNPFASLDHNCHPTFVPFPHFLPFYFHSISTTKSLLSFIFNFTITSGEINTDNKS